MSFDFSVFAQIFQAAKSVADLVHGSGTPEAANTIATGVEGALTAFHVNEPPIVHALLPILVQAGFAVSAVSHQSLQGQNGGFGAPLGPVQPLPKA